MLHAYYEHGMTQTAVFELFVRKLPPERNFLVAAGLEQALEFIEQLRFGEEELEWIGASGLFRKDFVDHLSKLRFSRETHALPEGTVFLTNEPLLRVTAPLPEAQILETRVMNLIHYQTLVASKAARSVLAARAKGLVDFGLRRAHGAEAGLLAARASYLAGFTGTATTLAARKFGIPVLGTMAHSFIQAHELEEQAFERFAGVFPKNAVLLLDTYDTVAAARKVVALAKRGVPVRGVRLDSGDLAALSREFRSILDAEGLADAMIFATVTSTSAGLRSWSMPRRRSTASASARASSPRPTSPTSTWCTSSRNMRAGRGASTRPARRPGQGASRSIDATPPTARSQTTWSR
jgi:nicotinate phosphoribosyltransferase